MLVQSKQKDDEQRFHAADLHRNAIDRVQMAKFNV